MCVCVKRSLCECEHGSSACSKKFLSIFFENAGE